MKIRLKMQSLSSEQHFMTSMGPSRMGNSHDNSLKWAKIELVPDFMPVLVICMLDEDTIKNEVLTIFSTLYDYGRLKGK